MAALLLLVPLILLFLILTLVFFICGPALERRKVPRMVRIFLLENPSTALTAAQNYDFILFFFAAGESILMNYVATEFLKVYVGRPRPAFFELCNYKVPPRHCHPHPHNILIFIFPAYRASTTPRSPIRSLRLREEPTTLRRSEATLVRR